MGQRVGAGGELGRKENRGERGQTNQEKGRNKGGEKSLTKKKRKYPHQVRPSPDQKGRGQDPYCRQSQPLLPPSQRCARRASVWVGSQAGRSWQHSSPGNHKLWTGHDPWRHLLDRWGTTFIPRKLDLDANISISQRRKTEAPREMVTC